MVLHTHPSQLLEFANNDGNWSTVNLQIWHSPNDPDTAAYWTLKAECPGEFQIEPPEGVLKPREETEVKIAMRSRAITDGGRGGFQLNWVEETREYPHSVPRFRRLPCPDSLGCFTKRLEAVVTQTLHDKDGSIRQLTEHPSFKVPAEDPRGFLDQLSSMHSYAYAQEERAKNVHAKLLHCQYKCSLQAGAKAAAICVAIGICLVLARWRWTLLIVTLWCSSIAYTRLDSSTKALVFRGVLVHKLAVAFFAGFGALIALPHTLYTLRTVCAKVSDSQTLRVILKNLRHKFGGVCDTLQERAEDRMDELKESFSLWGRRTERRFLAWFERTWINKIWEWIGDARDELRWRRSYR